MKYPIVLALIILGCSTSPGRLESLTKHGIPYQSSRTTIDINGASEKKLTVHYSGCGGLHFVKDGHGIMIDPFFSNQKIMRIAASVLGGGARGKQKLASDPKMVTIGMKAMEEAMGSLLPQTTAILVAHSHYDHLMDVPAVYNKLNRVPMVYLNESGFNSCYNVIDTSKMVILEKHMTTKEVSRPPIILQTRAGKIHIYPILAEHNPHFKNIKFFSGSKTKPVADFTDANAKTRGNDWLEGNTFSFLIDYIDGDGAIEFRIFVQSSSCNPPAGIPPLDLLKSKPVDLAFLGVASYHFSPDYPCTVLQALKPQEVVWIHWEDFFRKYTKKPKTVRGTDVIEFFDLPCLSSYKTNAFLPLPGTTYDIK